MLHLDLKVVPGPRRVARLILLGVVSAPSISSSSQRTTSTLAMVGRRRISEFFRVSGVSLAEVAVSLFVTDENLDISPRPNSLSLHGSVRKKESERI
jgi:hypothetical protein